MKAVRQTAQNAVKILAEFCEAHGMDTITAAYGWKRVPESLKSTERFWAYYDRPDLELYREPVLVGWGSLFLDTRDADDDDAHLVVGVFPFAQRKGFRLQIYKHMVAQAKKLGADQCSIIVKKTNEGQFKRTMREAHAEGSEWIYAGDVWFPAPGYGLFVWPLS